MTLIDEVLAAYTSVNEMSASPTNIVVCTHAKFSTLELCRALQTAGKQVSFHPVSYSKEAKNVDTLLSMGVQVIEREDQLLPLLETADCVIEDGARISKIINRYRPRLKPEFFSVEQTSGGAHYLTENPPAYPVVNVAMSPIKLDIDNGHATPEAVIQYFASATGKSLSGKQVFIFGFGSVGEGLACVARSLGAMVTVFDTLASKRMFAKNRGYQIVDDEQVDYALSEQDVIFTATNTYQGSSISIERVLTLKDGAIVCNAGSGRGELAMELQESGQLDIHDSTVNISHEDGHIQINLARHGLTKRITILAHSFPINLHLGQGTSHDAIEVVMSLMLLAALNKPTNNAPGLQPLASDIEEHVARLSLQHNKKSSPLTPAHIKTYQLPVHDQDYGGVFCFDDELQANAQLSMSRVWVKPDGHTEPHYYRHCQQVYYVEKGAAEVTVWSVSSPNLKQAYNLVPGDYLLIPENHFHEVHATSSQEFECLVVKTPHEEPWDRFLDAS